MSDDLEKARKAQERLERAFQFKDFVNTCHNNAASIGAVALNSAVLLNGAAAVAVLAFLSQNAEKLLAGDGRVAGMVDSLEGFVWGALAAVVATGLAYLRYFFESKRWNAEIEEPGTGTCDLKFSIWSLYAAIIAIVASYGLFYFAMKGAGEVLF